MTVVNPKSISGINSITTGSGSDDLLTIHNNNGTERLRVDSTGATKITTGIVTTLTATTGIVTTLTTNTLTANSTAKVGSGVTLSPDGDIFATGVCTATSFSGDGSNLTGISGLSVANQSDNRLVTATGTTDALNAESGVVITSDSELIVGMTAGGGASEDARLQVRGDTYAKAQIQVLSTHNDDNPASLQISKSRGSGNTILGDNDDIGQLNFASNDGNGFHNVGRIMVSHDGSGNGNDDLPSMMRFYTTANGGVTLAERLRISSNGDLLYAQSAYNYACWYKTPTNSSSNAATSNSEVLVYGTAVIANTDVYNTSNGRYTAPVDGLYHIRANGLIDNNAAQAGMQLKLYKNGSEYGTQIAYNTYMSEDSPNRYKILSGTGIMYMSTGDYAQIWATSGMHTSNETNFIVYLIRGTF